MKKQAQKDTTPKKDEADFVRMLIFGGETIRNTRKPISMNSMKRNSISSLIWSERPISLCLLYTLKVNISSLIS